MTALVSSFLGFLLNSDLDSQFQAELEAQADWYSGLEREFEL